MAAINGNCFVTMSFFPFLPFAGDKFRLVLCTTLREDGIADDGHFNPLDESAMTRANSFEYVMYGKVYRIEGDETATESASKL